MANNKFFILIFSFYCLPSFALTTKDFTLPEAIAQGLVQLQSSGEGGHSGKSLKLVIQNNQKKKLRLHIPAGLIFHSQDTSEQDLIVINSRAVEFEKAQKRTIRLYGMCTQASNSSPGTGSAFQMGSMASGNLGKLVSFIDEKRITEQSAQYAIWAITDTHSLANIDHPELLIFTAKLLGKIPPEYTLVHAPSRSRPGAPAFVPRPSVVKGTFRYQTDKDIKASFGLYNDEGALLHSFFDDQAQRKGHHQFKFHFEINNLPSGKYFARLMNGVEVVRELEVEF